MKKHNKHKRKLIAMLTAFAVAAAMMPVFASAGTSAEKTEDNDYHYTALGDSITAGQGAACKADSVFSSLDVPPGFTSDTLHNGPEGTFVNLLANKLNNWVYSLPEDTTSFKRNSDNTEWENVDENSIFSFSNAATSASSTKVFLEILNFNSDSTKTPGTDAYYEDLFDKNFCDDKGNLTSTSPVVYSILRPKLFVKDGELNKVEIAKFYKYFSDTYHDELVKADLTTLAVGSNDELVGFAYRLYEMLKDDNSGIFNAIRDALVGTGIDFSSVDLSKMSNDTLTELLKFAEPAATQKMLDQLVEEGLKNYDEILSEVTGGENDHNDIVLVSLYKPFGDSPEFGGKSCTTPVLFGDILDELVELVNSEEYKKLGDTSSASSETSSTVLTAIISWIKSKISSETGIASEDISIDIKHISKLISEFAGSSEEYKTLAKKLWNNKIEYIAAVKAAKNANDEQEALIKDLLVSKITMPLIYALVGATSGDSIDEFNEGIKKLADKYGLSFADISALPTDEDVDPHPSLEGHKWIADKVYDEAKKVTPVIIYASDIKTLKASTGKRYVKVRYSPANSENVTGYNIQYRVYGSKTWKIAKNTRNTTKKITGLKKDKKYSVRVRAYNRNSTETVYGSWKTIKSAKVK